MAIDAREENNEGKEPEIIYGATESELVDLIDDALCKWMRTDTTLEQWFQENKHRFKKIEVDDA